MPTYFTIKQAALILGYSTNSIYKFVNIGRLKNSRGNSRKGRFRITKKALEDFLGQEISDDYIKETLKLKPKPARPDPPPIVEPEPTITFDPPIPLNVTRGLIILSLFFIIADIFISQNFSLVQQLIRLTLLAIIIVITYQFGSPNSSNSS